jgi:hypothetical protein
MVNVILVTYRYSLCFSGKGKGVLVLNQVQHEVCILCLIKHHAMNIYDRVEV